MKTKALSFLIIALMIAIDFSSCSNNNDINPEDYITSVLTGKYEKNGSYKLSVTVNGQTLEDYGYVDFVTKSQPKGDFSFVNVIPGVEKKDYKDVPLTDNEDGINYTITDSGSGEKIVITGIILPGTMTVNITM